MYAVGIQSEQDGDITWKKYVWCEGMCFLVEPCQNLYINNVEHLTTRKKELLKHLVLAAKYQSGLYCWGLKFLLEEIKKLNIECQKTD